MQPTGKAIGAVVSTITGGSIGVETGIAGGAVGVSGPSSNVIFSSSWFGV
jgi:hypothetical protein